MLWPSGHVFFVGAIRDLDPFDLHLRGQETQGR